ncbi:MAG: hypothetical protein EOP48_33990, partial [Sphingobacteriales bacterium]
MRPYSEYLENIKNEKILLDFNYAGTTPSLRYLEKFVDIGKIHVDINEFRTSQDYRNTLATISNMFEIGEKNISFFQGTSLALLQIMASLTKQGDCIALESPTYSPVKD